MGKKEHIVREKTNYKNIYFNQNTEKYDVKYNYKEYDPLQQKNVYKSKWIYNIRTLTEARQELAKLQTGQTPTSQGEDITLAGAFELWKIKAEATPYSPVTIDNTTQHMQMIYKFLPAETKIKNITEDVYYKLSADCRNYGYAEETLHSINATFRKLINLCHKKKLIKENILQTADNIRTKQKDDYKTISKEEFDLLDGYFQHARFVRLGVDNYPKYRLMLNLLYYTGIRIGECLALTYADFEEFSYYKRGTEPLSIYIPNPEKAREEHLRGMRVRVEKAYVTDFKITKSPKNLKKRTIPLYADVERLFIKEKNRHLQSGGNMADKIFDWGHSACVSAFTKACAKCKIDNYTCHEFRHTFISNLISRGVPLPVVEKVSGDTQATILKRYSHMFESDEVMVLQAMADL